MELSLQCIMGVFWRTSFQNGDCFSSYKALLQMHCNVNSTQFFRQSWNGSLTSSLTEIFHSQPWRTLKIKSYACRIFLPIPDRNISRLYYFILILYTRFNFHAQMDREYIVCRGQLEILVMTKRSSRGISTIFYVSVHSMLVQFSESWYVQSSEILWVVSDKFFRNSWLTCHVFFKHFQTVRS